MRRVENIQVKQYASVINPIIYKWEEKTAFIYYLIFEEH